MNHKITTAGISTSAPNRKPAARVTIAARHNAVDDLLRAEQFIADLAQPAAIIDDTLEIMHTNPAFREVFGEFLLTGSEAAKFDDVFEQFDEDLAFGFQERVHSEQFDCLEGKFRLRASSQNEPIFRVTFSRMLQVSSWLVTFWQAEPEAVAHEAGRVSPLPADGAKVDPALQAFAGLMSRVLTELEAPASAADAALKALLLDSDNLAAATEESLRTLAVHFASLQRTITALAEIRNANIEAALAERIDLQECLTGAIEAVAPHVPPHSLSYEIPSPLPALRGHRESLQHLFTLLMRIVASSANSNVATEIQLTFEELPQFFAFHMRSSIPGRAGTGANRAESLMFDLSLAICNVIVARHGGILYARSRHSISFTIPKHEDRSTQK